ncbi:MAG TPA: carboxypeptidase-like regulatory domain-containing protein, partial [Niastella sp.]
MPQYPRLILCCLLMVVCTATFAQETTATLNGVVYDPKGAAIAGASVIVKHEPTGFSTGTQTNSKGIFVLPNLKPGGPYTIVISFTGFKSDTLDNVNLTLGNNPSGN